MNPHPSSCPVGRWLTLPAAARDPRPACTCQLPGRAPGTVGVLPGAPGDRFRVEVAAGAHVLLLDLDAVDDGGGQAVYRGTDGSLGWTLAIPGAAWRAAPELGRRLQVTVSPPVAR